MTRTIRSYATSYARSRFRSRLEARWAAFFDLIGWRWIYEPFDTEGYAPDFLIHGEGSLLVEIGPCEFLSDFSEKSEKAREVERPVLILGIDPLILNQGRPSSNPSAGYLTDDNWGTGAGEAFWASCKKCSQLGIYHGIGSYRLLPCGDADGAHYLGSVSELQINLAWRDAGNRVQWRAA